MDGKYTSLHHSFFLDYFQVLLQRKRASERVGRAGRGRNEKREMNTGRVHARERHRPIQRDVVLFVSKFAPVFP